MLFNRCLIRGFRSWGGMSQARQGSWGHIEQSSLFFVVGLTGQITLVRLTKTMNQLYTLCTDISPPLGGWFGLYDCFGRAMRSVFAFYYLAITHPISFFQFSLAYNYLWYGKNVGYLLTLCFYVVWPFAVLILRILLKLKNMCIFKKSFDDGNVFFVAPSNPVSSLMWDFYKEFSVYSSLFIMCGHHQTAIDHSWYDTITQKPSDKVGPIARLGLFDRHWDITI